VHCYHVTAANLINKRWMAMMSANFADAVLYLKALLVGAGTTMFVSFVSIGFGVFGGLALCFVVMSNSSLWRKLGSVYISFFRGTPILVQLLVAFYLLPTLFHVDVPPIVAAITVLAMNTTAFQAEIYRGGFLALPPGQLEAARILGIGLWQARRRILIPHVMRLVFPTLVSETITILKNSSLVSVISVTDLTRVSQQIVAVNFRPTEVYLATALIYLAMNTILSYLGWRLEARFRQSCDRYDFLY
jgi:polar amino acid transport system permease protein